MNQSAGTILWRFSRQRVADSLELAGLVNPGVLEDFANACIPQGGYAPYEAPPESVRDTVQQLFAALQKHPDEATKGACTKWSYGYPPWHWDAAVQLVRTVPRVLGGCRATCIGWVLLAASLLANVGVLPLIFVVRRREQAHAILGYWLYEAAELTPLPGVYYDGIARKALDEAEQRLTRRWGNRVPPILGVVDAVCIAPDKDGKRIGFDDAEERARQWLPEEIRRLCFGASQAAVALVAGGDPELWAMIDVRRAQEKLRVFSSGQEFSIPLKPPECFLGRCAEEKAVGDWWKSQWEDDDESTPRVLSLTGLGGVGKTAIVHRFLAHLPSCKASVPGVAKDPNLAKPDRLFTWDFNAKPDVARALACLCGALSGEAPSGGVDFVSLRALVAGDEWIGRRVLLVLDGFEELQRECGQRGSAWVDENARDFGLLLSWCVQEDTPLRCLLTSRCEVADIAGQPRHCGIGVDDLAQEAALALLSAWGIQGTADQMRAITEVAGTHPQTLACVARALVTFRDGQAEHVNSILGRVQDEHALRAVMDFYEDNLEKTCLRLMRLLSLLWGVGLSEGQLLGLLHGLGAPQLTQRDVQTALATLTNEHGLVVRDEDGRSATYRAHPSLKLFFRDSKAFDAQRSFREAIVAMLRQKATRLDVPLDPARVADISELVLQLGDLGVPRKAYEAYLRRMSAKGARRRQEGPYDLLTRSNLHPVGLRVVAGLLESDHEDMLKPWEKARLLNDKGGYERELGAVRESRESYDQALEVAEGALGSVSERPSLLTRMTPAGRALVLNRSFALRNPARTLVHQGLLHEGLAWAERSFEHERRISRDREGQQISLCLRARALGLRGDVAQGCELFERAERLGRRRLKDRLYTKGYAVRWADQLMRRGRGSDVAAAKQLIDRTRFWARKRRLRSEDLVPVMCDLVEAQWGSSTQAVRTAILELETSVKALRRREADLRWCVSLARAVVADGARPTQAEEDHLKEGLLVASEYGYALHWIDLQVAKGMIEFAKSTPGALRDAHSAARCALYGWPLSNDPANDDRGTAPDRLVVLGAANTVCEYVWGRIDALDLLVRAQVALPSLALPQGRSLASFEHEAANLRAKYC